MEHIRKYKEALAETLSVSRWVTIDMMTPELRVWWIRFLLWLCLTILIGAVLPVVVGHVLTNAASGRVPYAMWITVGICGIALTQEWVRRNSDIAREWLWGVGMRVIEDTISTLLFSKSLGQHIQEGSKFTVGNLERGQSAALFLRELWFIDLIPQLIILALYPSVLLVVFPQAGLIMIVGIIMHLAWTVVLNRYVLTEGDTIDEYARAMRRYQRDRWDKTERVKVSAAAQRELAVIDEKAGHWIGLERTLWIRAFTAFMMRGWMMHIVVTLVMLVALYGVMSSHLSVGVLYASFSLAYSIKAELDHFSRTTRAIMRNVPVVKSLRDTLFMPALVVDAQKPISIAPNEPIRVSFEAIGHGFGDDAVGQVSILNNVSFTIREGEKVALIGPSGAGKTTLMRLLLRYMDPDQGRVVINGVDLRDISLDSWMQAIGYIPQHAQIFDGTVRENLTYGLRDGASLSDSELWHMVERLQINFGERLTDGLDTVVGRNGLKLSGGQAQRLMIGAAAIKRPRFMIIDEATSSLDATTERLVHDGLKDVLGKEVGALIVTHRLATVRDLCDRFVVLRSLTTSCHASQQLEATASSFEELWSTSATFRELAQDQGIVCA